MMAPARRRAAMSPDPAAAPPGVGLPRRLGCMLYDLLALAALAWAASLPLGGVDLSAPGPGRSLYQSGLLLLFAGYFVACWRLRSATVGMQAWLVRVVGADGGRIGWRQALLRALGALAAFACLGLGYWVSLAGAPCWPDRLSGTRLVRAAELRPSP